MESLPSSSSETCGWVPLERRRPALLELSPRNVLEAFVRFVPMPAWPRDTKRSTYLGFCSGDPDLLANLEAVARRFVWISLIECSACTKYHTDMHWVLPRVWNPAPKWIDDTNTGRWYAANMCCACHQFYSMPNIDRETHFWCGMCRAWIHRQNHWNCSHYYPSMLDDSDFFDSP